MVVLSAGFFGLRGAASSYSGSFAERNYDINASQKTMQHSVRNALDTAGPEFKARNTNALMHAMLNRQTPTPDMSMVEAIAF